MSYNVHAGGDGVTIFSAGTGRALVRLHSDPSHVVEVPDYHQVRLWQDRISDPQPISRYDIESMTDWRRNFSRYRNDVQPPTTVSVPNLRNRNLRDVRRTLDRLGLQLSVNPSTANSQDLVSKQYPSAGVKVKKGSVVRVNARAPITMVTVPNLNLKKLEEVKSILTQLGLGLRFTPPNARDDYWVYKQSPGSGVRVKKGSVVHVNVQAPIY